MHAQSIDISHVLKKNGRKCLLISCARLSRLTSQIPAMTKYNTSLYAILDNSSSDTISYI
jgi:hypothetical protein